jgi:hypothetical protein
MYSGQLYSGILMNPNLTSVDVMVISMYGAEVMKHITLTALSKQLNVQYVK